ncbi:MAG: hypothetical protein AAF530_15285 [Pseudomonadota bacterium]
MWRYTLNHWDPAIDTDYPLARHARLLQRVRPARNHQRPVAKCYLEPRDKCPSIMARPSAHQVTNPLTARGLHIS